MDFFNHMKRGYGFLSGFPPISFTMYSNFTVEIRKRLNEFEEIEIARQSRRGGKGGKEARRKTLKTFVLILSKNSVSECSSGGGGGRREQ